MYIKQNGRWIKITKRSIGAVTPSELKRKREAFERKKQTTAFKQWRRNQYFNVQGSQCFYCQLPIKGALITDHVIPLYRGGTSSYDNLVVCCWSCNKRKGIKIIS